MIEKELSNIDIILEINKQKKDMELLLDRDLDLLKIAKDFFSFGSESHLNSLKPEIRYELGYDLMCMTQINPVLTQAYEQKKSEYINLGKSFSVITYLFNLVNENISSFDLLLLHELLMDDGQFRKEDVYIVNVFGEKTTFKAVDLLTQCEDLFHWYYSIKDNQEISPVVIAILFHYKLVKLHPFLDGNGRIARLLLNLILIKNGFFPILINNISRKDYYEYLFQADNGNFIELINFLGNLVNESIKNYINIASELEKISPDKTLLVLTEDGNTSMLEKILTIHGIDLSKTEIESFEGKTNLGSAMFFASKLIKRYPTLKHILIHIDKDNDNIQTLKQIVTKHLKSYDLIDCSSILVTNNYDIESYFLNEEHINYLYPEISTIEGYNLIEQATILCEETSKSKLRKAYADYGRYKKLDDPQEKAKEINNLYDSDPEKYRYGKEVLWKLEELITKRISAHEKISLSKYSDKIQIEEIKNCKLKVFEN